jgi:hypothetical protein
MSKASIRRAVDQMAPGAAKAFRRYPDTHTRRFDVARPTPWGFTLAGDAALAESRAESHEADL